MLDDKRVIKYKLYGNNLINMSKKTTKLPQKTSIVSWDLLTWLDSEDANLSTKDKVFSVNNIWNRIFTDRSTTNLAEWTNLYYTEARVTANTTVVWLWNTKADKTNVLEKDNTTAYTPTLDYHPATKKFVVDRWTDINWLTEETTILDTDEVIFYDVSASGNKKIEFSNFNNSIQNNQALSTIASDNIKATAPTERTATAPWTSPVEFSKKEITHPTIFRVNWTVRLKAEAKWWTGCSFRFYKNWTQLTSNWLTWTYTEFTTDTTAVAGDIFKCILQVDDFETAYVKNFTVSFDEVFYSKTPTVNLD